jgi:lysophospholipase L1-like esterase
VLEGINDIGLPGAFALPAEEVSADEIIDGLQQLIERAHERRLMILGGTLTPFEGTTFPGYYTPAGELKRQTVNAWIRTKADFDAVIDFDQVVRDPSHPTRLLPAYDCGDHLHPNDAGYQAMADSINLKFFEGS